MIKKLKKNRGFVILFAVTLSAILLSIALGVANIAFREIRFGVSAKDTNEAFFAADIGAECAFVHDKSTGSNFISRQPSITCNNTPVLIVEDPLLVWQFIIPGLGSEEQGCAKVTVDKSIAGQTTVFSKGYNIGSPDCNSHSSNLIEREIEFNY